MQNFSKKTGDFSSLSQTDMELIAIAYNIIIDKNLGKFIRKEPNEISDANIDFYNKNKG